MKVKKGAKSTNFKDCTVGRPDASCFPKKLAEGRTELFNRTLKNAAVGRNDLNSWADLTYSRRGKRIEGMADYWKSRKAPKF